MRLHIDALCKLDYRQVIVVLNNNFDLRRDMKDWLIETCKGDYRVEEIEERFYPACYFIVDFELPTEAAVFKLTFG